MSAASSSFGVSDLSVKVATRTVNTSDMSITARSTSMGETQDAESVTSRAILSIDIERVWTCSKSAGLNPFSARRRL